MQRIDRETSRIAITALKISIVPIIFTLLFCFFTIIRLHAPAKYCVAISICLAILAFLLGIVAVIRIIFSHKSLKGYTYSILAILLSLPFIFVLLSLTISILVRSEAEKANMGTYNLRLLGSELIKYADNHDGFFPVADQWCDALMDNNNELSEDNFRHPKPDRWKLKGTCHFAFNKNLSGKKLKDISNDTVLLFEADGDWNLNGTAKLLKTRYWDKGYITLFYVNKETSDYWYNKRAVRKFDSRSMYYEQPRWNP